MLSEVAAKLFEVLPTEVLEWVKSFVENTLPNIDTPILIGAGLVLGYGIFKKVGELIGVVVVCLLIYLVFRYIGIDLAALV